MFDDDFALFFDDDRDNINKDGLTIDQSWCSHDFIPVLLLTSTVWDCRKCGIHKERYEKENNNPKWGGL